MAKSRKTVSIDFLIDATNKILAEDFPGGDEQAQRMRRIGAIDIIEAALNAIGRYRGYTYLDETQIVKSNPGIRWTEDGHSFQNTDPTRRRYA